MIYLDMDGVLVDMELAVLSSTGGVWKDKYNLLPEDFFLHLPKKHDADELVFGVCDLAKKYNLKVEILTAIPRKRHFPSAKLDKAKWIQRYYPFIEGFNIGPHPIDKQNFSGPGKYLIDDSPLNIPQWNSKGGIGILHASASDSLYKLTKHLEQSHESKK